MATELAKVRALAVRAINEDLTDPVRIGRKLRAARMQAGLKQAEVAKLCGIARGNLGRTERGDHGQSLSVLERYCNAVGLTIAELFAVEGA